MLVFVVLIMSFPVLAADSDSIRIIPKPVELRDGAGLFFTLPKQAVIAIPNESPSMIQLAAQVVDKLARSTGYKVTVSRSPEVTPAIRFMLYTTPDTRLGTEGYRMVVTTKGIVIGANAPAGLFYAMQTFWQLMPREVESAVKVEKVAWQVPAVVVTDYPRFAWRGMMFDVSRHFFTKQEVKRFIDNMVKYKFNLLHLHLTDDQGWRLQIKSLPKLTEVGAWRAERTGRWGEFSKPTPDEPKTYGGFYTQEDIKEIIRYAADRFVTILPEIDIPGHSMAAVASYPDLSCTPGTYQVNAGDRFMIWKGKDFYGTTDNTLCPANERVYTFLDSVFTEVAKLFPFEYIHVGGDECYKGFWEKSEACQQLMRKEGLKNVEELQSYFIRRVEKIVQSKGKKLMGWDEILQGGLAPDAAVMSWQGTKGGIEAAGMKHYVVMSPNDYAYVDLYQGDPVAEPPTYSMVRLSKAYAFDPLPPGVDAKYILGGQCNLWSERLYTMRHAEYMLWPRAFATAESLWSPAGSKNWKRFVQSVEQQFDRFDVSETKYARSMYDPIFTVTRNADSTLQIKLETEVEGLDIYYSFDETEPDRFYPKYQAPLQVPKEASNLKVITYRGRQAVGKLITMPVAEMKRRSGMK